jgi:hypothetical protein
MSEEIAFPKKWKEFSEDEQKEWIRAYYMPKTRIPEPILLKSGKIKEGILKLENGAKIKFPTKPVIVSKSNPNIVREFEFWVGKWLITVFHDKNIPCLKFIGISNPTTNKWIAQELSYEVLTKFFVVLFKIGNKYRLFQRKNSKTRNKKRKFTLSLRDNRGEKIDG